MTARKKRAQKAPTKKATKARAPASTGGKIGKLVPPARVGRGNTEGSKATQFKAGAAWNGNSKGRPVGARQKLTESFLKALQEDFLKNGEAVIEAVREKMPDRYLNTVARLVPAEAKLDLDASDAFTNLWRMVASGELKREILELEAADDEAVEKKTH